MAMYGASSKGGQTEFRVWAPKAKRIQLRVLNGTGADRQMKRMPNGDFQLTTDAQPGDRYFYLVDDDPLRLPDPVSRFLPEGVHGPTQILDPDRFRWTDQNWSGLEFGKYINYELHVGTFSPQGTFNGVIEKLDYLKQLGITAIELMPVAAFPGKRNWGYDGVSMYAVQESYGGPEGLKRLVNAAHGKGLAVVLDVVYNHLGSEGNYLSRFGPYFTSRHKTPWGDAINFDDVGSEGVRNYIVENARYWVEEYHIDGLRLDAVHEIKDESPQHILSEMREAVQQFAAGAGRLVTIVAETDENLTKYVRPPEQGGYGLNGVWSDDFHHAAHAFFTREREGYYQDYGSPEQIVKAMNEGFVFQGEKFKFWGKPRGESSESMPLEAHVICIQNHDQVGNRALGERLAVLVPRGVRKLMAALLLVAPETPLIFMGQEYDEHSPFQFFTDFGDPQIRKAVSEGRRREFKDFSGFENEFPDPQDPATFERSKLKWKFTTEQQEMLNWYRQLLEVRQAVYSNGVRTCRARLRGPSVIELQAPGGEPLLKMVASWSGDETSEVEEDWSHVLKASEDGCSIGIWLSPRVAEAMKPLYV